MMKTTLEILLKNKKLSNYYFYHLTYSSNLEIYYYYRKYLYLKAFSVQYENKH